MPFYCHITRHRRSFYILPSVKIMPSGKHSLVRFSMVISFLLWTISIVVPSKRELKRIEYAYKLAMYGFDNCKNLNGGNT